MKARTSSQRSGRLNFPKSCVTFLQPSFFGRRNSLLLQLAFGNSKTFLGFRTWTDGHLLKMLSALVRRNATLGYFGVVFLKKMRKKLAYHFIDGKQILAAQ